MGKIVTIYLSDEETRDLKEFCDENQCTQYSALKTAVRQLLSKPIQWEEEDIPEEIIEEPQETIEEVQEESVTRDDAIEESVEQPDRDETTTSDPEISPLRRLLRSRKRV